jgi:hypothetical protein
MKNKTAKFGRGNVEFYDQMGRVYRAAILASTGAKRVKVLTFCQKPDGEHRVCARVDGHKSVFVFDDSFCD